MTQAQKTVHVRIEGLVQGVAYRAWTEREALRRGLEGWVRNLRDGSVEAIFAGAPSAVEEMIRACGRGPLGARVDQIDKAEADPALLEKRHPGERFSVLPTR